MHLSHYFAFIAAAICTASTSNASPLDLKFGVNADGYDFLSWKAASLSGRASALDVNGIYTVGSTLVGGVSQSFVLAVNSSGFSRVYGSEGIAFIPNFAGFVNQATSIIVDGESKALIAGEVVLPIASCSSSETNYGFVARFGTDGSIDNSFGNSTWTGTALVQLPCSGGDNASYLALDSTGRIVLTTTVSPKNSDPSYVLVARFDANGKSDASFGTNGQVVLKASESTDSLLATNIFVSSKNEIFVSAINSRSGAASSTDVFKLSQDGSFASGFGDGGTFHYVPGQYEWTCCLAVDGSDRVYISGSYFDGERYVMYVTRVTSEGAVDAKFGQSGTVLFGVGATNTGPKTFLLDPSGGFRILGYAEDYMYDTGRIFLLHANADGTLNAALGSGGVYEEPCGFSNCYPSSMAVDQQNRPTITIYSGQPILYRYDEMFGAGFE